MQVRVYGIEATSLLLECVMSVCLSNDPFMRERYNLFSDKLTCARPAHRNALQWMETSKDLRLALRFTEHAFAFLSFPFDAGDDVNPSALGTRILTHTLLPQDMPAGDTPMQRETHAHTGSDVRTDVQSDNNTDVGDQVGDTTPTEQKRSATDFGQDDEFSSISSDEDSENADGDTETGDRDTETGDMETGDRVGDMDEGKKTDKVIELTEEVVEMIRTCECHGVASLGDAHVCDMDRSNPVHLFSLYDLSLQDMAHRDIRYKNIAYQDAHRISGVRDADLSNNNSTHHREEVEQYDAANGDRLHVGALSSFGLDVRDIIRCNRGIIDWVCEEGANDEEFQLTLLSAPLGHGHTIDDVSRLPSCVYKIAVVKIHGEKGYRPILTRIHTHLPYNAHTIVRKCVDDHTRESLIAEGGLMTQRSVGTETQSTLMTNRLMVISPSTIVWLGDKRTDEEIVLVLHPNVDMKVPEAPELLQASRQALHNLGLNALYCVLVGEPIDLKTNKTKFTHRSCM